MGRLTEPVSYIPTTGTSRSLRWWAVANLVVNIGIIVTGAVVRLTDSGLGCPTWPRCVEDSFVPHESYGIHGVIEFGNRLLTFVLLIVALATVVTAFRAKASRRFKVIAILVLLGIPLQGVVGGITVWLDLNPWAVALHLLLSVALIVACTWLVARAFRQPVYGVRPVLRRLIIATFAAVMVAIYLGTIVTGSGPNSGDGGAARTGFDIETVARLHAFSVWIAVALSIATIAVSVSDRVAPVTRLALILLATELIQGLIGYVMYFTALPALLVSLHMLGIGIVTTAAAYLLFRTARQETVEHQVKQQHSAADMANA